MRTIVGIGTALGSSGVALIRLSGINAKSIAQKLCFDRDDKPIVFDKNERRMLNCNIKTAEFMDDGLCVFYKSPNSFTGEDVIEIFSHGGVLIPQKVVEECIKNGAVQSIAGEFSKRAFINGKLSLDRAEGIIDSINAECDSELVASEKIANGDFGKKIKQCQDKLKSVLAGINTLIDFPSEDGSEEEELLENCKTIFKEVCKELANILKTTRTGRIYKTGIMVTLCGRPNAGKSSVLNAMASNDCAIVSNIPGTTRDVVKETILYNGIKFNLCDTAGLRVSTDEIEKMGILRTKEYMQNADIILYIIDGSIPITNEDLINLKDLKKHNLIVVVNKTDLIKNHQQLNLDGYDFIEVSALNNKSIEELKQKMLEKAKIESFDKNAIILTNARHSGAISDALVALAEADEGLDVLPLDVLDSLIQSGYNKLGEITGECGSDAIATEIFSKFCVGK